MKTFKTIRMKTDHNSRPFPKPPPPPPPPKHWRLLLDDDGVLGLGVIDAAVRMKSIRDGSVVDRTGCWIAIRSCTTILSVIDRAHWCAPGTEFLFLAETSIFRGSTGRYGHFPSYYCPLLRRLLQHLHFNMNQNKQEKKRKLNEFLNGTK